MNILTSNAIFGLFIHLILLYSRSRCSEIWSRCLKSVRTIVHDDITILEFSLCNYCIHFDSGKNNFCTRKWVDIDAYNFWLFIHEPFYKANFELNIIFFDSNCRRDFVPYLGSSHSGNILLNVFFFWFLDNKCALISFDAADSLNQMAYVAEWTV